MRYSIFCKRNVALKQICVNFFFLTNKLLKEKSDEGDILIFHEHVITIFLLPLQLGKRSLWWQCFCAVDTIIILIIWGNGGKWTKFQ